MAFYVYILQSEKDGTFYKGSATNPIRRFHQHNNGESRYTATKKPWKLVYVEELSTKKEMLVREKKLKRGNKTHFEKLIKGDKNIAVLFG